jgi:hypothetical protein
MGDTVYRIYSTSVLKSHIPTKQPRQPGPTLARHKTGISPPPPLLPSQGDLQAMTNSLQCRKWNHLHSNNLINHLDNVFHRDFGDSFVQYKSKTKESLFRWESEWTRICSLPSNSGLTTHVLGFLVWFQWQATLGSPGKSFGSIIQKPASTLLTPLPR